MNAGKVLACDAPQKLIDARGAAGLEDAFIGYMEDAIARCGTVPRKQGKIVQLCGPRLASPPARRRHRRPCGWFNAWVGCWPTPTMRPSRFFEILCDWPLPLLARRC